MPGYDDVYCNLSLYLFRGEHFWCARLRPANQDAAAACVEEVRRLVAQKRQAGPKVRGSLRGDSGFCRDTLMSWWESIRVDYVSGRARVRRAATGKPARGLGELVGRWGRRTRCEDVCGARREMENRIRER